MGLGMSHLCRTRAYLEPNTERKSGPSRAGEGLVRPATAIRHERVGQGVGRGCHLSINGKEICEW